MTRFKDVTTIDFVWNVLLFATIAFTAAKLTDTIDWSWWLVLSPLLVPLGFMWAVFISLFIFWFFVELIHRIRAYLKELS